MIQYDIIKRPLITEKTTIQKESFNQVTFEVDPAANRVEIKRAIENIYNVKVIKINTLITPNGKKKAFIKLHPDNSAQTIAIDLGIF